MADVLDALRFYADERSWQIATFVEPPKSKIGADRGKRAREALEAAGWQPIATAPRDGRILLCDMSDPDWFWPVIGEYSWDKDDGTPVFMQDGGPSGPGYTHWMPLPEPPDSTAV